MSDIIQNDKIYSMREYKVVVVLKGNLPEGERKKLHDTVVSFFKGLKVTKDEDLGSKALSYKIKGQLQGHFYALSFTGDTFPVDFEKRMADTDDVLRHLVLRVK